MGSISSVNVPEGTLETSAHPDDVPEVWMVRGGACLMGVVADPKFELDLLKAEQELVQLNSMCACRSCVASGCSGAGRQQCAQVQREHCVASQARQCKVPFMARFQALLA
eukprot:CAMPEP_0179324674 /NCGR_PEP_ID=MMETSP0797-20121207/60426_1 /TAXON_ID=47934 /ORGANISM="Dinophysis acuminata, Strain DAEP01" /LENGTH=109 /DNA_ID=CAMNT_0021036691 /DNA_START=74 /DNA_END=403 /DNA_ORIENTATION=-